MTTFFEKFTEISPNITGVSRTTVEKIINTWLETENEAPKIRPSIPTTDFPIIIKLINDCIKDSNTGDISRHAKTVHLVMIYIQSNQKGKEHFLKILAENFNIDRDLIFPLVEQLKKATSDKEKKIFENKIATSLIPPRIFFLKKIISLPNGFIFLKDIRQDLHPLIQKDSDLQTLDNEIKDLLKTYFDVNLLILKEITWDSPASLLEKLIENEAVHEIVSWNDLKYRLFSDHKIYAFLHPTMPLEPLIFVEVAFTKGLATSIQNLLDPKSPQVTLHQADTAIFYSISNAQKGLYGISYGNFLIKRVVRKLRKENKNIQTFSTLSPLPKFMSWLKSYLKTEESCNLLKNNKTAFFEISGKQQPNFALLDILEMPNWYKSVEICSAIKLPLLRLCWYFLAEIKHSGIRTYDPVANFHLSNGAKIEQINWLGDISENGMKQSAGILINYKYKLNKIASNHEEYRNTGKIYFSKKVISLVQENETKKA